MLSGSAGFVIISGSAKLNTEWYLREVLNSTSPIKMKFYYVYILRNKKRDYIYIGFTEDLIRRFKEHNLGLSKSTKSFIPLDLIHYEAYKNIKDAKRREGYLKTNKGRTTIMTMLKEFFNII